MMLLYLDTIYLGGRYVPYSAGSFSRLFGLDLSNISVS